MTTPTELQIADQLRSQHTVYCDTASCRVWFHFDTDELAYFEHRGAPETVHPVDGPALRVRSTFKIKPGDGNSVEAQVNFEVLDDETNLAEHRLPLTARQARSLAMTLLRAADEVDEAQLWASER